MFEFLIMSTATSLLQQWAQFTQNNFNMHSEIIIFEHGAKGLRK